MRGLVSSEAQSWFGLSLLFNTYVSRQKFDLRSLGTLVVAASTQETVSSLFCILNLLSYRRREDSQRPTENFGLDSSTHMFNLRSLSTIANSEQLVFIILHPPCQYLNWEIPLLRTGICFWGHEQICASLYSSTHNFPPNISFWGCIFRATI
jgi:hypothetical protein